MYPQYAKRSNDLQNDESVCVMSCQLSQSAETISVRFPFLININTYYYYYYYYYSNDSNDNDSNDNNIGFCTH